MCRGWRWGRRWRRRWRRRRQLGWGRTLQQSGRYGREHLPSACLPACDTSSHATSWAEGLSAGHGCTQHSGLSTPHDVGFHEQSPHRIHDPLWRHPLLSCSNCGKRAKKECQFTKVRRSCRRCRRRLAREADAQPARFPAYRLVLEQLSRRSPQKQSEDLYIQWAPLPQQAVGSSRMHIVMSEDFYMQKKHAGFKAARTCRPANRAPQRPQKQK